MVVGESRVEARRVRQRRNRALASGIGTALAGRALSAIAPLVLVPIALPALGHETYAVWMTAVSFTAMFAFADLGLGQGLLTALTPLLVENRRAEAKRLVTSVYLSVTMAASVLTLGAIVACTTLNWGRLLGVNNASAASSANLIVLICLLTFFVNIPLSLVTRVLYAFQRVAVANLFNATAGPISLSLAWAAIVAGFGPEMIVLGALLGPIISSIVASIWTYLGIARDIRPAATKIRSLSFFATLGTGAGYLALNLVMALASNIDNPIIAHVRGAEAVTSYSIVARLFLQVGVVISLASMPLWATNGDALARGDAAWVVHTSRRMAALSSVLAGAACGVVLIGGNSLFTVWTRQDLHISRILIIGWSAWWMLMALLSPYFMVQNSVGVLKSQLIGWTLFCVLAIPLKAELARADYVNWIPLASAILGAALVLPACVIGYRVSLNRARH